MPVAALSLDMFKAVDQLSRPSVVSFYAAVEGAQHGKRAVWNAICQAHERAARMPAEHDVAVVNFVPASGA
eukprot:11842866-Alexandrium_andersonii.AAC.1